MASPTSAPPVLILGASTRAAAGSAIRAGFHPHCVDQFADADLEAVAPVVRIGRDPHEFVAAAASFPAIPVVYTGGLENHPEVLEALQRDRPLWGISGETLRAIRDPLQVAATLSSARLPCLQVARSDSPPPADGTWLIKPLRSGGGRGILAWTPQAMDSPTQRGPHYFQQRAEGLPCSGVFIAREGTGDVRFVGLTEQIVSGDRPGTDAFVWQGNIGPLALNVQVESTIRRIANFLKWKFGLCGLFGIDFVLAADGKPYLTEVNPRYPASLEILEFATGIPLFREHCECFCGPLELPAVDWQPAPGRALGKLVVYSPAVGELRRELPIDPLTLGRIWPEWGDIPNPGATFSPGEPVLTAYAQGDTAAECRELLLQQAEAITKAISSR